MAAEPSDYRTVSDPDAGYEILRALASPLVAVTVRRNDRANGLIANSAVRASLVPGRQNVACYIFKRHLTHEILVETGVYVLHLLSRDQWEEIWALGFHSGRDVEDKLAGLPRTESPIERLPLLTRCYAWMECRVANVMDAGAATFFMGRVLALGRGTGEEIMDSPWFREHMPEDWKSVYEDKLGEAQERAALLDELDDAPWRALRARGRSG